MDRKGIPVRCPKCKRQWAQTKTMNLEILCPDCALAELQEECQRQGEAQAQLEADRRMERLAEGDGCCESVAVVAAGCGAIVWGLMKAAGWC